MTQARILVADDEQDISKLIKTYLERENYAVDTATNGREALDLFSRNTYQLIVLDIMMPEVDGMEVCQQIRSISNIPIMMLTAKNDEIDKIVGLRMGADDYITKPFSIHELVARIKAQLRRYFVLGSEEKATPEHKIAIGDLQIDLHTYSVVKGNETIQLTAKEFELLAFLAKKPNQVFTKAQIFRNVWSEPYLEDDNTVMVHINRLRKKIERDPKNPKYIQTVWGIGYKFAGAKKQ